MKLGRGMFCLVAGLVMTCALGAAAAYSQVNPAGQATGQKPQMSEEAFKNIQVLRGIPVKEFMETMGFFAASLSLNCVDCHGDASGSDWANYATDTPLKNTARRMVVMVKAINQANFGGMTSVTCYTCHRGNQIPKIIPSLAVQYGESESEDPDEVDLVPGVKTTATAEQILDKYIQAVGGAAALAKLTSYTAKGTYEGFDSDFGKVPVDVYAKAPDMRTTVAHMIAGDSTSTYDGREAWSAGPSTLVPVPVMPLLGADLEGARLEAQLFFPGQIKQVLSNWQVGFPALSIDNKPVQVVQGAMADGTRVKLYFDRQTGLLVRETRYSPTAIGPVATHTVYSDYRLVPSLGVKVPYKWQVTWVDGQYTINLTSFQPNARIDAAKFGKPSPPPSR